MIFRESTFGSRFSSEEKMKSIISDKLKTISKKKKKKHTSFTSLKQDFSSFLWLYDQICRIDVDI